ncbi:D-ribose pyranase [Aneurinibacillus sp. Ricciae_BoGa-3]|uniref:D-ribose pyranase n=1 Tax=Aneurinibacillus sp. Ricciae_BoGa-3 TaxID=3022697 RepID=UPI002340D9E5|nr:D-ribose pyranase [Aneurinibacillus sp. Ricciae_BoGa-3]WCK56291.1 D-ribose pyranase [Aneurinibacillus sp. Ricciae_BoGa-3]
MKRSGILNPQLSRVIAETGHTDLLVVTDAGLPIPQEIERVDLSLVQGKPAFLDVLREVVTELEVEKIILAEETEKISPNMYRDIVNLLPGIPIETMPHEAFKEKTKQAKAAIRSGEFTSYANVILVAGVVY